MDYKLACVGDDLLLGTETFAGRSHMPAFWVQYFGKMVQNGFDLTSDLHVVWIFSTFENRLSGRNGHALFFAFLVTSLCRCL